MSTPVHDVELSSAPSKEVYLRKNRALFLVLWSGQTVSMMGSELSGFALGIWVYQHTGSTAQFSLTLLCSIIPATFLSPLIGLVADYFDRRVLMVLSNAVAAAGTVAMAILYFRQDLHMWHICIFLLCTSFSSGVIGVSFTSTIPSVVPRSALGRASGMVQSSGAVASMAAPLLAGFLIGSIGIHGIFLIDFATYVFACASLLAIRLPAMKSSDRAALSFRMFLTDLSAGFRYLRDRPGMLALIGFFATTNFAVAIDNTLLPPVVISAAGARVFGIVAATGGAGMILGGLTMTIWRGPARRVLGVYVYGFVLGTAMILEGVRQNVYMIGAAVFVASFVIPIANACSIPILQSKTPADLQGRVYTTMRFFVGSFVPVAYLVAGWSVDKIFQPLMSPGGALHNSIGEILGVGPGRGAALLVVIFGIGLILITLRYLFYSPLMQVESLNPDAIS